ncbi:MAG: hypothetical protein PHT53_05400, partial [Candidatus Omnitrophica bacterium]|nr:hypothetical protein [Candidatus Omnitrophota bacterium]
MDHVYWFKQDFSLKPQKQHIGASINYTDIKYRKDDFIQELVNTITSWVFSKAVAKSIIKDRLDQVGGEFSNAATFLATQAFSKFRPGHPQGQFGELLLF